MRLMISPSKNAKSFYVIKSVQKNGKNTSEIQATKKPHNYHKIAVWQKDD